MHTHPRVGRFQFAAALLSPVVTLVAFANLDKVWAYLWLFAAVAAATAQTYRLAIAGRSCDCPAVIGRLHGQVDALANAVEQLNLAMMRTGR